MDKQEYERIVKMYSDSVYRIALSYAPREDAEDVLQNTFLKLYTQTKPFADEEHIRRWLIRVAVNECRNLAASFWRRNIVYQEPEPVADFTTSESEQLFAAFTKLPPKCRIVLHLFYYEDYTTKEIAALLRIPDATVRSRLSRARKLLKQQLLKEDTDAHETRLQPNDG